MMYTAVYDRGTWVHPISHIGPEPASEPVPYVLTAGRVLEIKTVNNEPRGGGHREAVRRAWSHQSRNRLVKMAEAITWEGKHLFITLTYQDLPKDGKTTKAHLKAFKKRWERKFGIAIGMWKLEFQRRGVPHFHFLLKCPAGFTAMQVRCWIRWNWYDISGQYTIEHLLAGTSCDYWHSTRSPGGYFAKYGTAKGKEYQNHAPDGWDPGRWWGCWHIKPDWKFAEVTLWNYFRLRRIMFKLKKSRGARPKKPRFAMQGGWARGYNLERIVQMLIYQNPKPNIIRS